MPTHGHMLLKCDASLVHCERNRRTGYYSQVKKTCVCLARTSSSLASPVLVFFVELFTEKGVKILTEGSLDHISSTTATVTLLVMFQCSEQS